MQRKKNDVKARTTLLLSLPDEHQNDLDTMSLDDLYNHLKVYESEVQKKTNWNSHNMAFIFSSKNSSRNEDGNNACVSTSSTTFPTASANVATISQGTASAYIASQSNGSQIKFEDINQIDEDDMEEIDKSKVECFNYHKMGHFSRECRAPRRDDHALVADGEAPTEFALMTNTESKVFDNSLCSNEFKYIEKIRTLEMYRASNLKCIKILDKELEELKLEKDGLDGKLAGLLKASKNLDHLIESQRFDQVKEGVGYNAVPPPATDLYLSPKKDLSWTDLPEFVDDTVTDYSKPTPNVASTSAEGQNKDSSTSEDVASPKLPKPFVKQKVQRETSRSQNHAYMGSSHRFVGHRPHGAPMRTSHKSIGHRPHGASMKPSNRTAGHRSHGPSMYPRRPTMNGARPYKSFFNQAPSYETRPFLKSLAVKTPYRALWVPTANRNNPPVNRKFSTGRRNFPTVNTKFPTASRKFTTSSIKNHTVDMGRKGKAVKRSACWTWNPS
nr:hypothetical protein [Tanacetum cinerariifolium]